MNRLQYKIVKSVLAVGADPIKFAKMCKAEPMDFIAVQTTDNFDQYIDTVVNNTAPFDAEQIIKDMMKGKK